MGKDRPVKIVCCRCGSSDVLVDAYAEWNFAEQKFEVSMTYMKHSYCNTCNGETTVVEQPVKTEEDNVVIDNNG